MLAHQQQQQFCVEARRNPGCVPAAVYASAVVTHFLTCRRVRECGSSGADHQMFARQRPQSSGSAQFCGILNERVLAPVSDEKKKHEAAEATAETRAEP